MRSTPAGDVVHADPAEPPAPVIEGLDGLVGTRDQESAEISGTLAYDRLTVDRDEVIALAGERLLGDAGVLPSGHELLASATEVTIGEARRDGDALIVAVTVTGASTPAIDREEVIDRVRGQSAEDARAALADLGDANRRPVARLGQLRARYRLAHRGQDRRRGRRGALSTLIGLDHGSRRIGVAVGDTETGMAFARAAIIRRNLEADLAAIEALVSPSRRSSS